MDFSKEFSVVFNKKKRRQKAVTIIKVLEDIIGLKNLKNINCLEIGCAAGIMTDYFADFFNSVCGIDTDSNALTHARAVNKPNLKFLHNSATDMTFDDNSFDIVICNHIYDHVEDAEALYSEIRRVLKPGGLAYTACTNKYWLLEPHYNLLFLSFLPGTIADIYLKLLRKKERYDINLMGYNGIVSLFRGFNVEDITCNIISNKGKYELRAGILNYISPFFVKLFYYFVPNYIFILRKE